MIYTAEMTRKTHINVKKIILSAQTFETLVALVVQKKLLSQ